MADFYGSRNGESLWPDAKPAPEPVVLPEPEPMRAPQPAPQQDSGFRQNAPAVQPLVIVPYVSQMQPLYQYTPEAMRAMYGPNGNPQAFAAPPTQAYDAYDTFGAAPYGNAAYGAYNGAYEDDYEEEYEAPAAVAESKKRRRANAAAIVGFIFGLIAVAFMVIGYFGFLPESILPYLCVYKDATVINIIMTDLIEAIMNIPPFEITAILVPGLIALSALLTIITLLTNLFSVAARKYPIAGKVFAWLAFLFAAGAVGYLFFTARADVKIGAYVLAGITLLIAIICTTGRRK